MSMIRAAVVLAGAFYVLAADESRPIATSDAARQSAGPNQVECGLGASACATNRLSWQHLDQNIEEAGQLLARLVREHVASFEHGTNRATAPVATAPVALPGSVPWPVPNLTTMRATAAHAGQLAPIRSYLMDYPSPRR